jgi:NAD-dependent dihydropyrimidine dehydrogenase PreA subunit
MNGYRYIDNVVTLQLAELLCIGCGRCLEVCPHQVFVMTGKKAQLADLDACMECGACALNCPVAALTVEAGVGCASGMINEWLREHNLGGNTAGGCCS